MFIKSGTRQRLFNFIFLLTLFSFTAIVADITSAEAVVRKNTNHHSANHKFAQIVIDAQTGEVLSQQHADKQLYPASLTKMMTLYMAFEALSQGKLNKGMNLPVSRHASYQVPSSLKLRAGERIRVVDAILSIVTKSANDSAVVLAEAIGGSEREFAKMMTAKARELGMSRTNFVNASGLYNKRQVSTARDMAKLGQALIRDYPSYYHYFSTSSFTYKGNTYKSHNKLMKTYDGMDGLKTGYIYASGYNLAASAVRNGTRLIGVVFGGRTTGSRNQAMAKYLDQGFSRVKGIQVAALNKTALVPIPVRRPVIDSGDYIDNDYSFTDNIVAQINSAKVIEQGDADLADEEAPEVAAASTGRWMIQLGLFPNRLDGVKAIVQARRQYQKLDNVTEALVPLNTNRGMIYRPRISGLDYVRAREACDTIKGNCLVLAEK